MYGIIKAQFIKNLWLWSGIGSSLDFLMHATHVLGLISDKFRQFVVISVVILQYAII